jgi:hypothetical protein
VKLQLALYVQGKLSNLFVTIAAGIITKESDDSEILYQVMSFEITKREEKY